MRRVFVQTWGCQMNEHDSERMLELLASNGYAATDRPEEADLILLNTCAVREKAVQKVRSAVGSFREIKQQNPGVVIGVTGCVAQQQGKRLLRAAPHLDFVLGPDNLVRLGEVVARARARERVEATGWVPGEDEYPWLDAVPRPGAVSAYVAIMKGCNNVCSFCVVPYVRGRERYRSPDSVVQEVRRHVEAGTREVTLLGQNVNSYRGGREGEVDFPALLRRVDAVPGLWRLRFATSHPKDFTERLADAMAELDTACEYLHLPVQSGNDGVLERMRRGYTRREFVEKVELVRRRVPGVAVTTDIIVGFPGETEAAFADTLSLLREVEFESLFPFEYSPRPRTAALRLPDPVPPPTVAHRFARLLEVQKEVSLRKNRAYLGRTVEVLVEGESRLSERQVESGQLTGRIRQNKIVNFRGDPELRGLLVTVRIIDATANSLKGELAIAGPRQGAGPGEPIRWAQGGSG
jgi:tRNA-2-methylthio-N6-dimethylallyladenosine synthase